MEKMPANYLQEALEAYCGLDRYPMHMPGHKRRLAPVPGLPYDWDVTEVEGTDDLHHAEGILKRAMERTAELVGSRRTWYLVGGSTCGNLAAMYAMVPRGSEVIAARNCHKSVYHAMELLELRVHWLCPEELVPFAIPGSIRPENVERMLRQFPHSAAVILTSPTYEGVLSDIRTIAAVVHRAGSLLLVDEAHGAHLGLDCAGFFPDSAVHQGADVVVQSAHKTLPSLTQTAYLHLCSDRVPAQEIEQGLGIFETSSPSYPLLASLDGCTGLLLEKGEELYRAWTRHLMDLREAAAAWENLCILGMCRQEPAVFALDPGKILVRAAGKGTGQDWNGDELAEFLRRQESIESEMHCGGNVLLMTTLADPQEGWERLERALEALNRAVCEPPERGEKRARQQEPGRGEKMEIAVLANAREELPCGRAVQTARQGGAEKVALTAAEGRICAEYVTPYPPGVPVLIPGERIRARDAEWLLELQRTGTILQHSR